LGDVSSCCLGIARDALKEIIVHLQGQVISSLKGQWQQDIYVDFNALQDVSDATQDQAVLVLLQLQQRIITAAPIKNLKPAPLFSNPDPLGMRNLAYAGHQITIAPYSSSSTPYPSSSSPASITRFPAPPVYRPSDSPQSSRPSTAQSQAPLVEIGPEKKGHFASVTKMGIFRRSSKYGQASQKVTSFPVESKSIIPYSGDHYNEAGPMKELKDRPDDALVMPKPLTRFDSVSTASSGIFGTEPDSPQFHPWTFPKAPTSSLKSHPSVSASSYYSQKTSGSLDIPSLRTSVDQVSVNAKDLLPGEGNKFAGFCKGAWRLQIGDKKKALMERQRPGGLYSATPYWQCSKCKFEGRMVVYDKKRKGFDTRVMMSDGVQFRWEFLFKSHVESKDAMLDPMKASFGCIFCCAEGRGTPTFGGVHSFVAHLQEHRDRLPRGEVLYRMNCLVGRRAGPDEDFDVNLIDSITEEFEKC
jgi:hypothetical protein